MSAAEYGTAVWLRLHCFDEMWLGGLSFFVVAAMMGNRCGAVWENVCLHRNLSSADVVKCLQDVKRCVGEIDKPKLVPVKLIKGKGGSKSAFGEVKSTSSISHTKPGQSKKEKKATVAAEGEAAKAHTKPGQSKKEKRDNQDENDEIGEDPPSNSPTVSAYVVTSVPAYVATYQAPVEVEADGDDHNSEAALLQV